jgi:RNA polymerase sigma-70 factor (ECF subfamily)
LSHQRELAEAFLAAAREGNFHALLEVLDPEVVLHADAIAAKGDAPPKFTALSLSRGARSRFRIESDLLAWRS